MCGVCGGGPRSSSWIQAGIPASLGEHLRARETVLRIASIYVPKHLASVAAQANSSSLIVSTPTGTQSLVDDFSAVWSTITTLTGKKIDPLVEADGDSAELQHPQPECTRTVTTLDVPPGTLWPTTASWLAMLMHAHEPAIFSISGSVQSPRGRVLLASLDGALTASTQSDADDGAPAQLCITHCEQLRPRRLVASWRHFQLRATADSSSGK